MTTEKSSTYKPCLEFTHDNYSETDYCSIAWSALEKMLYTFLNHRPGQYVPIKYEEMYCHIYRCVCKDYRERLYNDLITFVTNHVEKLNINIYVLLEQSKKNFELFNEFITRFHQDIIQYQEACKAIVAIFHYLNINYIRQKLRSDLNEELNNIYASKLIDKHINSILLIINDLEYSYQDSNKNELFYTLIETLYLIKSDYSKLNHTLFYKYSKTFIIDFNNDTENKLNNFNNNNLNNNSNNNYFSNMMPSPPTTAIVLNYVNQKQNHHNEEVMNEDHSQTQIQRKRHAENHPGEPRAKITC